MSSGGDGGPRRPCMVRTWVLTSLNWEPWEGFEQRAPNPSLAVPGPSGHRVAEGRSGGAHAAAATVILVEVMVAGQAAVQKWWVLDTLQSWSHRSVA